MILKFRSPLTIAAALLAGLALLAPGCGAARNRAETVTTAPTTPRAVPPSQAAPGAGGSAVVVKVADPERRAYIARVDRICRRLDRDRKTASQRVGESADAQEAATAYDDTIALGEQQLREIEAVPVPARDRDALRANVFGVIERQLGVRRKIRAALAGGDVTLVAGLRQQLDDLTRSLVGFARGYGYRVCGED